jgi:predicted  nucleic acid-binding Zn-ribbon protein
MNWLKNLFRQKKTIEEVKQWAQQEQEKQQQEQKQATDTLEHEFPELLINIRKAVVNLENAELQNPNIPERAKHFMQGNRDQFVKLTNRFVENLNVPKEAPDFSQNELFFQQYAQNTARPGAILSEFIGEEVKEIRKYIAETESRLHELKQHQLKKEQFSAITSMIRQMNTIKEERSAAENQKKEFEEQLQQLKNKHESLKKEKEDFTSKPEYISVKEDIINTARERQESERAITDIFLSLSDAIKKYAHQIKNEKIAKYADNPLNALIHDYTLGILKHVPDIKKAIDAGELELKPERVQKALDSLKQLTKENLGGMIHRYANAKKRETDIHDDIAQRPVMKEYSQYAEELKRASEEIKQLETTIEKFKMPTDEELKEMLKQELEKHKIVLI